VSTFKVVIINK